MSFKPICYVPNINYLHTTMFFLCQRTMPFVVSFIFEAIGLGNGTFTNFFLMAIIATVQCPSAIGFPWNVMPGTPHTSPEAQGILVTRWRSLTFVLGFKGCCKHVGYKYTTLTTICSGFLGIHCDLINTRHFECTFLQNDRQSYIYKWFWKPLFTIRRYVKCVFKAFVAMHTNIN